MTYRATLSSALGVYLVGAVVASLLLVSAFLSAAGGKALLLASVFVIAFLVVIRARYLVQVSTEELRARNLVGEGRVKWRDVIRVAPAVESGSWSGRLFGPAVLEFATASSRVRINFKLFSVECLKDVMKHVPVKDDLWGRHPSSD